MSGLDGMRDGGSDGSATPGTPEGELARLVGEELRVRRWTVGLAESCTGGLVSKLLTDLAGSSEYFQGSLVAYGNDAKVGLLGVPPSTIADWGAVSEEVAIRMAVGAAEAFGSDVGLSLTGIAGPGGGTEEKPVGTVWFGVHGPEGTRGEMGLFVGDRSAVREAAARHALSLLGQIASGDS